ncbi:hypothetical protein J3R80_05825 [Aliiroseovarius sp. Z3]|uniref:hypothetical protein n=1 Tax=Aliiroseovarius sp. Z3 TaxID=2811402 RepID=UPI0023B32945|nr:hypothetical protein [Aliiroseovarius sp. Z3]MDE9449985.1 hypothetical protein [Aliiroseovarius sp. Z3]
MAAPYKGKKKGAGRFVQLPEWLLASEAWQTMKPGPRALYVELKRQYKGGNNGDLFLSHRDAAKALCVGRDTAAGYFSELIERGFVIVTKGHCLGPSGVGQSATYALTEEALDGKPATKDFMAWKKQNPRRKTRHSLAGKSDRGCRKIQPLHDQMSENPTALGRFWALTVSENPAIYTSSHIPHGLPPFPDMENVIVFGGQNHSNENDKTALGQIGHGESKAVHQ